MVGRPTPSRKKFTPDGYIARASGIIGPLVGKIIPRTGSAAAFPKPPAAASAQLVIRKSRRECVICGSTSQLHKLMAWPDSDSIGNQPVVYGCSPAVAESGKIWPDGMS